MPLIFQIDLEIIEQWEGRQRGKNTIIPQIEKGTRKDGGSKSHQP
jgi:hypothetical protein